MPHPRSLLAAAAAVVTTAAALAGCPAPGAVPQAGKASPAAGGSAAPAVATPTTSTTTSSAVAALGRSLGEGLADERDLADYGYIFDDGSGIVAAGGGNMVAAGGGNIVGNAAGNMVAAGGLNFVLAQAPDPDDVDAPQATPALGVLADMALRDRLRAQRAQVAAKAAARLAARADRQAFVDAARKAEVTTNAAGTKTYRFTAALPWGGFTRQVHFINTVDAATNMLVHSYAAVLRPRPDRPRRPFHQVRREFTLREGGGFEVTYFQTTPLRARDLRRVVSWKKAVAADGAVTGAGTITWRPLGKALAAPVREVALALGGREDAEALTAAEAGHEVALEVPIEGPVRAKAKLAGQATATPLDLEAVPPEAPPEDPSTPTTP